MRVALIPARGGSRRIPRKNVRPFAGRPMIAYSIQVARASRLFDRVVVSTDDAEIAEVAAREGAEVPFRRPAELSGDQVGTNAVVGHALDWLQGNGASVEFACCIYPTAPFLRAEFLQRGLDALVAAAGVDFSFSVTSFPSSVFRALTIRDDGFVEMLWPENEAMRTQDLPETFHDAGQFYWGTPQAFRSCPGVFNARSVPVILPRHLVHDIDTAEDWERAELAFAILDRSAPTRELR